MEEHVLKVSGMTCEGCEQRIGAALASLPGVRPSAADHRSGEVRVVCDPERTSAAEIRDVVVRAGYQVAR